MFRTSLQTITWGDPQHERFHEIFALAQSSGFEGLEIGFRRLGQVEPEVMMALLARHGMRVNASHIGGNLGDPGQAANERVALDATLAHLAMLKVPYLLYSGLNESDDSVLDAAIDQLNVFAERCAQDGIALLYHNHNWEFEDGGRIWNRLRRAKSDALGHALDLGWAGKAGKDMGQLLDELDREVKILHFKDFVSEEPGENTCHLGEGIIDFSPAWRWLQGKADRDIWLTAEQDHATSADDACVANGAYLVENLERLEKAS
ncbi:sugar phosphate isomerase/epimerase family protein [Pararhizobium mangrovi]|nr:TIM barrel protein [Pararhizobium mangrovi]